MMKCLFRMKFLPALPHHQSGTNCLIKWPVSLHLRLDLDLVMIIMEEDNSLLVPGEEPKGRFVAVSTTMGDEYRQNLIRSVKEMDMQDVLSLSKTYMQNVENRYGKTVPRQPGRI